MGEIDVGEAVTKGKVKIRGRFGRFTKALTTRPKQKFVRGRERRRADKEAVKRIEREEREMMRRKFIRAKVKQQLSKKFTPGQFKLREAERKARIRKLTGQSSFGGQFGGRSKGHMLLEGLGNTGLGAAPKKSSSKKPKRLVIDFG